MAKSYRIVQDGNRTLAEVIKQNSKGIFHVITTDTDFALAHLLNEKGDIVRIGFCTNGSKNAWRIVTIHRRNIRSMQKLSA